MLDIRKINKAISIGLLDLQAFSAEKKIVIKRELEKKGTLFLLAQLLGEPAPELHYTASNKPFLANSPLQLSISHSHDKLAIIVNRGEPTGIDIELVRDKILRVRHKFLRPSEQEFAGTDIARLISIWSAKEAMYKVYGLKGVDFREHMEVLPFAGNSLQGRLMVENKLKNFDLVKEEIENYIMVYVRNEIR